MPKKLITEWKRIGRSGPTVDGRNIEPVALQQAAKNYDKGLFTALVWPDHLRFFNLGTVEVLRTADNGEGGVDLFAKVAPNDIYLNTNKAGQRLFTSMELMPNFRDTGEYYLPGLAATDTPASAATTEMRFSALDNRSALVSMFVENTPQTFEDDQPPNWFTKFSFFQPHDDDMNKNELAALADKFNAMEQKIEALSNAGDTRADASHTDDTPTDDYSALSVKIEKLTDQVQSLADTVADKTTDDNFSQLTDELKALREEFNTAVAEANGTDAGEHLGDNEKLEDYI